MKNESRTVFDRYTAQISALNGVSDVCKKFSVAPSVQQTLEAKIQESSAFLQLINIVGVDDMEGEKIGLGVGSTIAGRTDTNVKDRETSDPSGMDSQTYKCYQTNFDTHISYAKIDMWAKFKNFQELIRNQIVRQQALDRIMIGFNGKSAAATTNRAANPLLQDVNIGWLEQIRTNAPARVMKEVVEGSGKIQVGNSVAAAVGYKNLDALVYDACDLIDPVFVENPDLVCVVGRQLLSDKYFPLLNKEQDNSEMMAADMIISQKRIGGLQAIRAPFVPANTILITTLDNLSIYYQNGGRRRHIEENPKRNRIENYESSNEAYVIENYGACCLIENIELVDGGLVDEVEA